MGTKYVVEAWCEHTLGYVWEERYAGQNLFIAIRAMRRAKRTSGCVRLEWR